MSRRYASCTLTGRPRPESGRGAARSGRDGADRRRGPGMPSRVSLWRISPPPTWSPRRSALPTGSARGRTHSRRGPPPAALRGAGRLRWGAAAALPVPALLPGRRRRRAGRRPARALATARRGADRRRAAVDVRRGAPLPGQRAAQPGPAAVAGVAVEARAARRTCGRRRPGRRGTGAVREPDREVLRLWAREGLEPRDPAVVMECSAGAAATRLSRARVALRSQLGQDPGGAGQRDPQQGQEVSS